MNRTSQAGEDEGAEEVFLDGCEGATGASPELPPLRRSARKRKSESDSVPVPTCKGKRPRPIEKKPMERTPDTVKKTTARTPHAPQHKPGPGTTTNESEQIPQDMSTFVNNMQALMREELHKTENTLSAKMGGLEERMVELEGRVNDIDSRIDE